MRIDVAVGNVPAEWANGDPVTREDRLAIALLRQAGCRCELPLLRNARDDNWDVNDGPRCKACDVNVTLVPPTAEEKLAYDRRSHQAALAVNRKYLGAFGGWVSECFTGCGCGEAEKPGEASGR
jgi:hypothetical protein